MVDKELISIDLKDCFTISKYGPPENIMETLYVKQQFNVSYKAYHELPMIHSSPVQVYY